MCLVVGVWLRMCVTRLLPRRQLMVWARGRVCGFSPRQLGVFMSMIFAHQRECVHAFLPFVAWFYSKCLGECVRT